jgi:tetratricopeptide (TPR) repeat protein
MARVLALLLLAAAAFAGGGPESTLVVVNKRSWLSRSLARDYMILRDIPVTNVVEIDGIPHLGVISMQAFRETIWKPIAARLKEVGPIRLITYSADFPYAVRFKLPDGLNKQARQIIGGQASLTGLTYLIKHVEAGEAFYNLGINPYYGVALPQAKKPRRATGEERGHYMRAQSEIAQKNYVAAAQAYAALLATYDVAPQPFYNYACCLARLGRHDEALQALGRAVDTGWTDVGHTRNDPDLAPLRQRPGFAAVLARMAPRAKPSRAFDLDGYYLSTHLGYTGFRGNTYGEIRSYLERAAKADGTSPAGTVYACRSKDVKRTGPRAPFFAPLVAGLKARGRAATIIDGTLPPGKDDVLGAVVGIAKFDWPKSKSTLLPGSIAEHLTSFGAHFGTPGQTKCTAFLRAGAAGSSGTVREPLAIHQKFPNPFIHLYYADGCSLAEAFYQSIHGPYQLMVIGDGLARPFAKFREVEVDAPPLPWKGKVEFTPKSEADRFELWVDGKRQEELSFSATGNERDVRVVAVHGPVATRSYKRFVGGAEQERFDPEELEDLDGRVVPGLLGAESWVTDLKQVTGPAKLTGYLEVPASGPLQLVCTGNGTLTVNGRKERLAPAAFVPIHFVKGWHPIELEYVPGKGKPRLEIMLNGDVVWQAPRFGHLVKPHKKQPERAGTLRDGLELTWKRAVSGIRGVVLLTKGKPSRDVTVESTVAKRYKAVAKAKVETGPGYVSIAFASSLRAKRIRVRASGEATLADVVVVGR